MSRLRFKQTICNGGRLSLKSIYARLTGKRIPLLATLYITDVCNLRCTHCGIHTVNNNEIKAFSTEEWIKIIDDLCNMGTEWFRFLGGEPLLRKDLKQLIDYVTVEKGKILDVVTNGINIEKRINDLENVQYICISIEGNKENHERVRGIGSFEKAVRAVEVCVDAGKYVRVHMVMNKYNIQRENIDFMINFCLKYGIQFDFTRLMDNPYFAPPSIPDYYNISDQVARDFYKTILKLKIEENIPISNSVRSLQLLIDWPFSYDKYTLYKNELGCLSNYALPECTQGNSAFELSSDGKLRLCVKRYDSEIDIVESGGIKKAWEKLGNKDCYQCSHLSCIEQSLMLNLDFHSVLNIMRLLSK